MKNSNTIALCTLMLASATTYAQNKVQCTFNAATNKYEASASWRNTLGAARANSYCEQAAPAAPAAATQAAAAPGAAPKATVAQSAAPTPMMTFITNNGERASQAMQRWASAASIALVWEAPAELDNELVEGSLEAASTAEGISNFINALNSINRNKGFPFLEPQLFRNGVIRIALKTEQGAALTPLAPQPAVAQIYTTAPAVTAPAVEAKNDLRRWQILASDIRLDNTLNRWAAVAGMKVIWDAKQHVMLSAEDTFVGSFDDALLRVLSSPAIRQSDYPLQACIYPNSPPVLRVTRLGEQMECTK